MMMAVLFGFSALVSAQEQVVKLPGVEIDRGARQVRVQVEAIHAEMPLEFLCVRNGGPEHEAAFRTSAKASDIHTGLLLLGLKPGEPLKFSEGADKWIPPHGPPLHISFTWTLNGKEHRVPAHRLLKHVKTGAAPPAMTWIFAGSRVLPDGGYGADVTGYVVSIVNFDFTLIDVPELVSNSNETLLWVHNPDTMPPAGAVVTMIIEPVGGAPVGAASATDAPTTQPADANPVRNQLDLEALRARWQNAVTPHADGLRQAAQTHYDVIQSLRREQQRLIDEADKLQRLIDELERQYQEMTTPRPADLRGDGGQ
jgi:hypothetical protein